MNRHFNNLFQPIRIGTMEVKNRTAMMAMGVFSPRLMNLDGSYTKDGADYYIRRAMGGVGMIVTGLVPITPLPGFPSIMRDPQSYIKNQRYLADGVHSYGAKVVVQMTALSGRSSFHASHVAACEIQNVWDPTKKNPQMSREEIRDYIRCFAEGASYAQQAGIDGVEIHAVHEGYLLDQFAISNFNHRTDEYGGSLENRLRFACEIVKAIKEKCGNDYPVLLRYSVRSYTKGFNRGALPGEDFKEFGRDMAESRIAAKMLVDAGYDALDCDNGTYDAWYWPHPPAYMPQACNLDDVKEIKKVVDVPVICAGKFNDPALANEVIGRGEIDMMGMGRALLADPDIVNKFASGELEDIRPCICCHQGCLGRIFQGKDISCGLNPACGREEGYALAPAIEKKRILIVGGGVGGMEAARVCALRGHHVDLMEKTGELGGAFLAAAAPSFKDEDKHLLRWYERQLSELKVNIKLNTLATQENVTAGEYDAVFTATGSTERALQIPGLNESNSSYAIETLRNRTIENKRVLIIGGGLTGCEIAYDLSKKGNQVTIVEMSDTIMNSFGLSAANYNMMMELLEYCKVTIMKNSVLQSYEDGRAIIQVTTKNFPNVANRAKMLFSVGPQGITQKVRLPIDHVVISIGYNSDNKLYEQIKKENVFLIGDAKQPSNVMEAVWSAYEIAKDI